METGTWQRHERETQTVMDCPMPTVFDQPDWLKLLDGTRRECENIHAPCLYSLIFIKFYCNCLYPAVEKMKPSSRKFLFSTHNFSILIFSV